MQSPAAALIRNPSARSASSSARNSWFALRVRSAPTAAGLALAGLTAVLLLAAFNTGNNLLYLLLSVALSLWAVEWCLGRNNLRGLALRFAESPEGTAGVPFSAAAALTQSGRFPALSILIKLPTQPACALLRLPPGRQSLELPLSYSQRGQYALGPARISSSYPFGWIRRARSLAVSQRALALPRPLPVEGDINISGGRDGGVIGVGEQAGDFADYRPGEDARWLHWPISARVGHLVVQRPLGGASQPETVVLRTGGRRAGDPQLERAISRTAGLLLELLRRGAAVRLRAPGLDLGPGEGSRFYRLALRGLALLDPTAPDPPAGCRGWVLTPGSADRAPTKAPIGSDGPPGAVR